MKPVDYRNETFEDVKGRLDALRAEIWNGMLTHGGAHTTREWAGILDVDLLTVRPRITELVQLGFAKVVPGESKKEGRYRACSNFEALQAYDAEVRKARNPQLELAL